MPCVTVLVDPPPSGAGWEPPVDGSDPSRSAIAAFPVLRLVIALPSGRDGWGGQRVEDLAAEATRRIEVAYGVRVDVQTFSDSAGGRLEPADKLGDLQVLLRPRRHECNRGILPLARGQYREAVLARAHTLDATAGELR